MITRLCKKASAGSIPLSGIEKGGEKRLNKSTLRKNYGFTLIELLIVIALLGALAVGLLATVDPFEQLKKGQDTSIRNTTAEIYNAAIRYYAIRNSFPWSEGAPSGITGLVLSDGEFTNTGGFLDDIISAGELKPEFVQLAAGNLDSIYLTSTTDGTIQQNVAVCFQPQSKSFMNDKNSKFSQSAVIEGNCLGVNPGSTGASGCFWCVK
jgi:prepilin-type N-terminal cleavage/methylation domain-containing protein